MSLYETTISKIQTLPEPLIREVNYFVDFLMLRQDDVRWQLWNQFAESLELCESDFSDYLANLETYEAQLAQGEVRW